MPEIVWGLLVALAWLGAAFAFRRLRRRTRGYAEGRVLKARLPSWVKTVESVILFGLWIPAAIGLQLALMAFHAQLHPNIGAHDDDGLAIILVILGAFLSTIVPSMLIANLVSWLVPPLRKANVAAMSALPTTGFARWNRELLMLGAIVTPLAGAQAILGAVAPWA